MKLRNYSEYFAFLAVARLARCLPRATALRFGRRLGQAVRFFQRRRTATARDNLQTAFPEMPSAERERIIHDMFGHLGKSFVEMVRLDMLRGEKDLERYFIFEGLENLRAVQEMGQGGILLTGHVGFWESGAFFLPQLGIEVSFVAKPIRNPLVDAYINRMRTSFGCQLINSRKGARRIMKALQQKQLVGLLIDQHVTPREAVRVPFFNRPAYTTPIIAQLAMKMETPILPSFVYRTDDNRYRVCFEPVVQLERGDMSEEQVVRNTALLSRLTEQGIRRELSQWFWLHRRWREKKAPSATKSLADKQAAGQEPASGDSDDAEA